MKQQRVCTDRDSRGEILRGTTHSTILVRSPDSRYFKEALFILRDDCAQAALSDASILAQAERAACRFAAAALPRSRSRKSPIMFAAVVIISAAAVAAALILTLF